MGIVKHDMIYITCGGAIIYATDTEHMAESTSGTYEADFTTYDEHMIGWH